MSRRRKGRRKILNADELRDALQTALGSGTNANAAVPGEVRQQQDKQPQPQQQQLRVGVELIYFEGKSYEEQVRCLCGVRQVLLCARACIVCWWARSMPYEKRCFALICFILHEHAQLATVPTVTN